MWKSDCHLVKIRKSSSPFTQCGRCDFLKSCAEAANNAAIKDDIIARLAMHFDFTASQMLALSIIWQHSQYQPKKLRLMSHYKMDQLNTLFPRLASMGNTGFMNNFNTSKYFADLIPEIVQPTSWERCLIPHIGCANCPVIKSQGNVLTTTPVVTAAHWELSQSLIC